MCLLYGKNGLQGTSPVKYTELTILEENVGMNSMPRYAMRVVCAGVLLAGVCLAPAAAEVVEEIVARVNDRVIVLSEYNGSLQALRQELTQQASGMELEGLISQRSGNVLRDLIDQQLLVQKADEFGLNADTEVIKRLDEIRQQMELPSMEALEQAVAQQGLNYEDFQQNLSESILTQWVISRDVGSRITVSPDDLETYYNEHKEEFDRPEGVHIRQIFFSTEETLDEELPAVEKKAEEVLALARDGEDFAELARKHSEDAAASNGGDAGFFERGLMVPEIEQVAFALEKDQVSDIIRTNSGLMILKLVERSQGGIPPLAEVQNTIHERLYLQKIQPALREYLTRLRGESYVSVKAGYVDSGAATEQASTQEP